MFADSEVTHAFIRGIDFGLERRVYGGMRMMMHSVVDQVLERVPRGRHRAARAAAQALPIAIWCRNIWMHSAA